MLTVSDNCKMLLKGGEPFFYLADTCWSAFTNISDEEWDYYLARRKAQGFNALQINILPQWDASDTDLAYSAKVDDSWYNLDDEYFAHARRMCEKAKAQGFELALVLLWCNYIPGTWGSRMFETDIMPYDAIDGYVRKVHETFTDLEPIYVITGDTDFDTDETIAYYVRGGSLLKELAPDCLFTAHVKGRYTVVPDELAKLMDLYFYQSGHNPKDRVGPYELATEMLEKHPGKPLINSEPCYEEMGYSGRSNYGRWTRDEVRMAAYQSVLAGASAGVTYGAAGIYSWHKVGKGFMSGLGEAFDTPKPWQDAVKFPGAWDYGYLKELFGQLGMWGLVPRQDLLVNTSQDIRVAMTGEGQLLVYVPHNTKVRLRCDLGGWSVKAIDLAERFVADVSLDVSDGVSVVGLHPFHRDVLLVIRESAR